jgi:DNA-binding transcriptional MocR family regulator
MDNEGIVPEAIGPAIARLLAEGKPAPKLLYLVPCGQNPTGCTSSTTRKQAVLAVARQFDLLIIEDDPYYYMQMPADPSLRSSHDQSPLSADPYPMNKPLSVVDMPGLQLPPSYFSLDVDSRVIRLDSLAKYIAPMMRLGWVCGHPAFIARLRFAQATTCQQPSGLSQAVAYEMLARWDRTPSTSESTNVAKVQYADGKSVVPHHQQFSRLHAVFQRIQWFYFVRRRTLMQVVERELTGLATWCVPRSGMFLWLDLAPSGVRDSLPLLPVLVEQCNLLVIPGSWFHAAWSGHKYVPATLDLLLQEASAAKRAQSNAEHKRSTHFRVTFASASEDELTRGISELARVLRQLSHYAPQAQEC